MSLELRDGVEQPSSYYSFVDIVTNFKRDCEESKPHGSGRRDIGTFGLWGSFLHFLGLPAA